MALGIASKLYSSSYSAKKKFFKFAVIGRFDFMRIKVYNVITSCCTIYYAGYKTLAAEARSETRKPKICFRGLPFVEW